MIFFIFHQVLIQSEALASRSSALLEVENNLQKVADQLRLVWVCIIHVHFALPKSYYWKIRKHQEIHRTETAFSWRHRRSISHQYSHQISRPDDANWIGRNTVAINHSNTRWLEFFLVFVISDSWMIHNIHNYIKKVLFRFVPWICKWQIFSTHWELSADWSIGMLYHLLNQSDRV